MNRAFPRPFMPDEPWRDGGVDCNWNAVKRGLATTPAIGDWPFKANLSHKYLTELFHLIGPKSSAQHHSMGPDRRISPLLSSHIPQIWVVGVYRPISWLQAQLARKNCKDHRLTLVHQLLELIYVFRLRMWNTDCKNTEGPKTWRRGSPRGAIYSNVCFHNLPTYKYGEHI